MKQQCLSTLTRHSRLPAHVPFTALAACRRAPDAATPPGEWNQVLGAAPWGERDASTAASFDGQLWVLGGWNLSADKVAGAHLDAWSSTDGSTRKIHAKPGWSCETSPLAAAFQDRLWVIGGLRRSRMPDEALSNEVWASPDGEQWSQVLAHAPWEARIGAALLVHRGSLWLLGGKVGRTGDNRLLRNDVWKSDDGGSWTRMRASAPWSARSFRCAVSFQDRIWLLGGGDWGSRNADNERWRCADGISWPQHPTPPWSGRIWHSCWVRGSKLWLMGGRRRWPLKRTVGGVWTTPARQTWWKQLFASGPGARHAAYVTMYGAAQWFMGGSSDGQLHADVWKDTEPSL